MGAGLYLIWPAFYTDVTDSYRLSRAGRLRVDLGGLYFNAVFSLASFAAWAATGWDPLLVLIVLQLLQMARQLVPLVRFDGYHVLADLVGVPDLFGRIRPVLRGLVPIGERSGARALKPWARAVITVWVALVVPILVFSLLVMVVTFPRLVATAAESLGHQWNELVGHWASGDLAEIALGILAILAIALPIAGIVYLLTRLSRQLGARAWHATDDSPRARSAMVLGGLCLATALAASWWPQGQYQPIARDERLTLPSITRSIADVATGDVAPRSAADSTATAEHTQLVSSLRHGVEETEAPTVPVGPAGGHVFPAPPAPGPGDNQAHAVGYDDGRTVTDSSTSLVWDDDGEVGNRNEAYALASCRGCRTSAVAFQVVLVVGQADTIAPVNKAVSRNERCVQCTTRSLAVQLVLPLDAPPDAQTRSELDAIWARSATVDDTLRTDGFDAARALVLDIENDIASLLELDDDLATVATTTTTTAGSSTTDASGTNAPDGTETTSPTGPTSTTEAETTTSTEPETSTSTTTSTSTSTSTTEPPTTSSTAPP